VTEADNDTASRIISLVEGRLRDWLPKDDYAPTRDAAAKIVAAQRQAAPAEMPAASFNAAHTPPTAEGTPLADYPEFMEPWKVYSQPFQVHTGGTCQQHSIGTEWDHPQLKSPYPIITLSYSATPEKKPQTTLHIDPKFAERIIQCVNAFARVKDPATELASLRAQLATKTAEVQTLRFEATAAGCLILKPGEIAEIERRNVCLWNALRRAKSVCNWQSQDGTSEDRTIIDNALLLTPGSSGSYHVILDTDLQLLVVDKESVRAQLAAKTEEWREAIKANGELARAADCDKIAVIAERDELLTKFDVKMAEVAAAESLITTMEVEIDARGCLISELRSFAEYFLDSEATTKKCDQMAKDALARTAADYAGKEVIDSAELAALRKDRERLEWIIDFLLCKGTDGFSSLPWSIYDEGEFVEVGLTGDDRSDVCFDRKAMDAAMVTYPAKTLAAVRPECSAADPEGGK
jgi:hypothetical protein